MYIYFIYLRRRTKWGQRQNADTDTNVTLRVVPNDDPFGVFSFPSTMREVSVAEDFKPGEEGLTMSIYLSSDNKVQVEQ